MLTTHQKTLRKFWYATVRLDALKDGPKPFRLPQRHGSELPGTGADRMGPGDHHGEPRGLESTSPDPVLDVDRRIEQHMPSDRPGMIMRRRLLELLRAHGEAEVTQEYA